MKKFTNQTLMQIWYFLEFCFLIYLIDIAIIYRRRNFGHFKTGYFYELNIYVLTGKSIKIPE